MKIPADLASHAGDASVNVGNALRDVADDLASITVAAPAALTATAVAALTALTVATADAAVQSGSYVQADVQTITALANALKTAVNALIVDVAASRTKVNALLVDVTALRAQQLTTSGATLKTTKA